MCVLGVRTCSSRVDRVHVHSHAQMMMLRSRGRRGHVGSARRLYTQHIQTDVVNTATYKAVQSITQVCCARGAPSTTHAGGAAATSCYSACKSCVMCPQQTWARSWLAGPASCVVIKMRHAPVPLWDPFQTPQRFERRCSPMSCRHWKGWRLRLRGCAKVATRPRQPQLLHQAAVQQGQRRMQSVESLHLQLQWQQLGGQ